MSKIITSRRRFMQDLFVAPAVIASTSLMSVRAWVEPRVMAPAANYGFYVPTWDVTLGRFVMKLNDKSPSQMFPEVEMTAREAKILADLDRALSADLSKDLERIEQWNAAWRNDKAIRVG